MRKIILWSLKIYLWLLNIEPFLWFFSFFFSYFLYSTQQHWYIYFEKIIFVRRSASKHTALTQMLFLIVQIRCDIRTGWHLPMIVFHDIWSDFCYLILFFGFYVVYPSKSRIMTRPIGWQNNYKFHLKGKWNKKRWIFSIVFPFKRNSRNENENQNENDLFSSNDER